MVIKHLEVYYSYVLLQYMMYKERKKHNNWIVDVDIAPSCSIG